MSLPALFGEMPGFAFDVAWLGSREEGHVDENLTSAGRRTAIERTAALIVMLYKRAKALGLVTGETFLFPLTQQHIADASVPDNSNLKPRLAVFKKISRSRSVRAVRAQSRRSSA